MKIKELEIDRMPVTAADLTVGAEVVWIHKVKDHLLLKLLNFQLYVSHLFLHMY